MKRQTILILAFLALAFTSCKKDSSNSSDLTTDIIGKFTSGSGSGTTQVIVNKVDNSTVSITINGGGVGALDASTHASSKMNSKTSFTLNSTTTTAYGVTTTYTGTGTYSSNNIAIVRHYKAVDATTGTTYQEGDENITASK